MVLNLKCLRISCEVIRDPKTGDSLQYAFIEFEEKASCEEVSNYFLSFILGILQNG